MLPVLDDARVHVSGAVLFPVLHVLIGSMQHQVLEFIQGDGATVIFVGTGKHDGDIDLRQLRGKLLDCQPNLSRVKLAVAVAVDGIERPLNRFGSEALKACLLSELPPRIACDLHERFVEVSLTRKDADASLREGISCDVSALLLEDRVRVPAHKLREDLCMWARAHCPIVIQKAQALPCDGTRC